MKTFRNKLPICLLVFVLFVSISTSSYAQDDKVKNDNSINNKAIIVSTDVVKTASSKKRVKSQIGKVSWYGGEGKRGAAGVRLKANSGAHKYLPFRTKVKVTSLENHKSTYVIILDRGPYVRGRVLDMVKTAFKKLHPLSKGVFRAKITW